MPSIFKVSILANGIVRVCLAVVLSVMLLTACQRSARPGAESAALASVALTLLPGVQRGIGESKSMEAVWISDEKQWGGLISSAPALMLGIPPVPAAGMDVDFTKCGVLLIRMGEKPNGGYGLTLTAGEAMIENREARIPVRWNEPEPEFFYTQEITYPYLAIKMEKGSFDSIAVIDQNGLIKLRLKI